MAAILLILSLFCINGLSFAREGEFFSDYLEKTKTNAIKGIFVIVVFLAHFLSYLDPASLNHFFAVCQNNALTQLIVTMFLFYSGYGILEAIKRKGDRYIRNLPQKAVKLLFHFDIAVVLFLCMALFLGQSISLRQFLLSLICWENIGNYNWYIFAIIVAYLISFLSFAIFRKQHKAGVLMVTLLCVAYILILRVWKPAYWYNTILCFPLGMWYSLYRSKIEKLIMRNDAIYFFVLLLALSLYGIFYSRHQIGVWYYSGLAVIFALLVILLSLKVQLDNPFLQFFGNHVFSMFMLQRLPMMVLEHYGKFANHLYLSFALAFICTMLLASIFDKVTAVLDKKIFR